MIYAMLFISVNPHRDASTQTELELDDGYVESTVAGCWLATSFQGALVRISPLSLVSRVNCVGTAFPDICVIEI